MTVVVVECAPAGLRGHLTRWLLEVRAGVYVGRISSRVRDHVWETVTSKLGKGSAVLIWTSQTEQGFAVRMAGDHARELFDSDGLTLVRVRTV